MAEEGILTTKERTISDYIKPLGKHGVLIVAVVLIGAIVGLLNGLQAAKVAPYEAEADVFFQPVQHLTLRSGAQSVPGVEQNTDPVDLSRQRNTVKALILSADVAQRVQQRAATSKEADIKALAVNDPLDLRGAINIDNKTDLISVKARYASPAVAAWLANTWAEEAIWKINQVYGSLSSSADVKEALNRAKTDLDGAEKAVQQFLSDNPINTLSQELKQTQDFLGAAAGSNSASQLALYDNERAIIRDKIAAYHKMVYDLEQQLTEIHALRTRIEQGPDDPNTLYNNQVALLTLVNKLASGGQELRLQLDLNNTDLSKAPRTKENQLRDIDASVAAVQKLRQDVGDQTKTLESKLSEPLPNMTPGTVQNVPDVVREQIELRNQLESKLEEKQFQLNQLQKTRDLHQSTYDLLRSRVAEQDVNDVIGGLVSIASPADYNETLRSRNLLRSFLIPTAFWALSSLVPGLALAYALSLLRPNVNTNTMIRQRLPSHRRVIMTQ